VAATIYAWPFDRLSDCSSGNKIALAVFMVLFIVMAIFQAIRAKFSADRIEIIVMENAARN
jgi:hypothetical protein